MEANPGRVGRPVLQGAGPDDLSDNRLGDGLSSIDRKNELGADELPDLKLFRAVNPHPVRADILNQDVAR